mgnify:CR=1 FL=1
MNIEVNYLAVLLAGVVSMVLGFVWYSPAVLGKPWMKERGMSADSLKKAQKEKWLISWVQCKKKTPIV